MSSSAAAPCTIRHARAGDVPAMLAIYGPIVRDTAISFEYEPPTSAELEARLHAIEGQYPWLVAERAGQLAGYAYASSFRSRAAYQWAVEVTVYVHPEHHRHGVARALYGALFDELRAQGFCTAIAVITLPNARSVALHERLGFAPVGVFRRAGFKLGQWYDIGCWQLELGEGSAPAPPRPPGTGRD
jgi:L-amino acid N-acyltransferase YncA